MILAITIGFIVAVISFILNYQEMDKEDSIDWLLNTIFSSFIGGAVGGVIGALTLFIPKDTELKVLEYQIVSLQDNSDINGRFFLGSGYIKQDMQYTFYYKSKDGFRLKQVKSDKAVINYSDNPRVIRYKDVPIDGWYNNWLANGYKPSERYKIYVPKGTIKTNYNLDAK